MPSSLRPIDTEEALRVLAEVPFLQSLDPRDLSAIVPHLSRRSYTAGECIIEEGQPGEEFFIVCSGSAKIVKTTSQGEEELALIRRAGQFFGEMALIDDLPRSASVFALEDTQVLVLSRRAFDRLLERHPRLSVGLVRELSRRLRELDQSFIRDLQARKKRLEEAFRDLQLAQEKLREQERIESELAIAKRIQESLLPQEPPRLDAFEIAALCRPAYQVGGDFYTYVDYGDETLGLAVGDVAGKSFPAALLMAVATSTITSLAAMRREPAELLATANRVLFEQMGSTRAFVALSFALLDGATRRVRIANAGGLAPILVAGRGGHCDYLDVSGLPLGVVRLPGGEETYQTIERQLEPGDLLFFCTDGFTEAMNDRRELFGFDRLRAAAAACRGDSPGAALSRVMEEIGAFMAGAPQHDDLTAIAVRVRS